MFSPTSKSASYNAKARSLLHSIAYNGNKSAANIAQTIPTHSGGNPNQDIFGEDTGVKEKKARKPGISQGFSTKCKTVWQKFPDTVHRNNSGGNEPDDENNSNSHHSIIEPEDDEGHSDNDGGIHNEDDINNNDEDIDDDEDNEDSHPRCDFKNIKATSNEQFEALVRSLCDLGHTTSQVCVKHQTRDTFNFVAIVELLRGEEAQRYVVRIPGHATLAHWTPEDAYMLEREVQLIEHIRQYTTAPVAEIIGYSAEHDNCLGFPYIVMTELPGKPAHSVWYDGDYEDSDVELLFQHADNPSTATEKKRITLLRSLARMMTDIQSLSFEQGGMPIISDTEGTTIGPMYLWKNSGADKAWKLKPFSSTQHHSDTGMCRQLVSRTIPSGHVKSGGLKFFNLIFSQPVFNPAGETFTIHHTDLDLQNILVDENGNVTGIIDWYKAFVGSRCMGTGAAPLFLQKDWLPDYLNDLIISPHMGWKTPYYREVYAAALVEAGNADAIYTTKSAMYRAALTAVWVIEGSSIHDLIDKLLREIPHCHIKAYDFINALGLGWKDAEDMLKDKLVKIFEPELPCPDVLAKLDADMSLKKWLLDFDMDGATDSTEDADSE